MSSNVHCHYSIELIIGSIFLSPMIKARASIFLPASVYGCTTSVMYSVRLNGDMPQVEYTSMQGQDALFAISSIAVLLSKVIS
jgi:methylaspartate ammonia-lyase